MRIIIFIFIAFTSNVLNAQLLQHTRVELDYDWRDQDYVLISNDEFGVSLVREDVRGINENELIVKHLDTDFNLKWEKTFLMPRGYQFLGYHSIQDKMYLMLQEFPSKFRVKILKIDNLTGDADEFEPKELLEIDIQEFEVIQNTVVIGGMYQGRPVVFAYDLENDKIRTLSNVYQNDSRLVEIRVNQDSVTFNVLASQENENRDRTIIVNTYDYLGNAIRDYSLETRKDYHLISSISSSVNDVSQVIVGLYAYKIPTSPAGIYVNYVDRKGQQTMKYYAFGELENFFSYLGEKKAKRYKEKTDKAKKGNRELRFRVHPLFTEMIEDEDELVVFGEFVRGFNKDINGSNWGRTSYPSTFGNREFNNFNNYPNQNQVSRRTEFDFSHSYLLVLDKQGNIKWDAWMEMDKEGNGTPMEKGGFHWLGDNGAYVMYGEEEVRAKLMSKDIEDEMVIEKVMLNNEDDIVKFESEVSTGTLKWYDNYFIVYGVHHLRSETGSGELRKVFFLNKISVKND